MIAHATQVSLRKLLINVSVRSVSSVGLRRVRTRSTNPIETTTSTVATNQKSCSAMTWMSVLFLVEP